MSDSPHSAQALSTPWHETATHHEKLDYEMLRIKPTVDSPHVKMWHERVGKLILNSSVVELECTAWLLHFTEDQESLPQFAQIPFKQRIARAIKLAEARSLNKTWRRGAVSAWNRALRLADVRNTVAHNPITFGWTSGVETGPPDVIGVPSLRTGKLERKTLLAPRDIDLAINEAVAVSIDLLQLREQWMNARDKGAVPPVPSRDRRSALQAVRSALRRLLG